MNTTHSDRNLLDDLRIRFKNYSFNIDKKIDEVTRLKKDLVDVHDRIRSEIDIHFQELIENELKVKKAEIENQIRLDFEKFESDVLNSINEANGKRLEIEVKFQNIDALKNIAVTNNKSNFYCDFDNNDDALMISEANEEILDTSSMNIQTSDVNNNLNGISDEELYKLEENINQDLSLNSIDSKLKQFLNQKFVKCKPDFTENCFGHLAADLVLDHTHFQIENNSVDNLFIKNQKCSIKICSPAAYSNDVNIHEYVKFEIFDPKKNAVNFELKERSSVAKRYTKIIFTPLTHGIHKLNIKHNNSFIQNCPLYFYVIKELTQNFINDYLNSNGIKIEPIDNTEIISSSVQISSVEALNSNNSNNNNNSVNGSTNSLNSRTISCGRGRLLKQLMTNNEIRSSLPQTNFNVNSNKLPQFQQQQQNNNRESQKRKSPLINFFQDNEITDTDVELCEISTKLKKVVVDENSNQYHSYSKEKEENKIFDYSRLSTNKASSSNNGSFLDNHLKKYSSQKFGDLPALKAVFQRKYSANMSFPIGVAVSNQHNWVLVADNGTNSVKIFERSTGDVVHELKGDAKRGASPFKRPSALLLNAQDGELYVKDDLQIQVFDIENNFNFKRRFGSNTLKRPYGLATNSKEDIVCVDADLRQPLIHTFDKAGNLINSKSYQPTIKDLTSSLSYPNLSKTIEPFEKSKVRFICSAQNCLYASDLGRSIVYKTTFDGEILFAFGHHGKSKGQLNEPSGIFVDKNGTILVGDSKNARLQIYDNQGKYKCDIEFVDDKIRRPSDIYLDQDGYLYVSCFLDHCVKKFKLVES